MSYKIIKLCYVLSKPHCYAYKWRMLNDVHVYKQITPRFDKTNSISIYSSHLLMLLNDINWVIAHEMTIIFRNC